MLFQVMYIKGNVPGEVGDVLLINDVHRDEKHEKHVRNPPFPTYFANKGEENISNGEKSGMYSGDVFVATNGEIFAKKLFRYYD